MNGATISFFKFQSVARDISKKPQNLKSWKLAIFGRFSAHTAPVNAPPPPPPPPCFPMRTSLWESWSGSSKNPKSMFDRIPASFSATRGQRITFGGYTGFGPPSSTREGIMIMTDRTSETPLGGCWSSHFRVDAFRVNGYGGISYDNGDLKSADHCRIDISHSTNLTIQNNIQ